MKYTVLVAKPYSIANNTKPQINLKENTDKDKQKPTMLHITTKSAEYGNLTRTNAEPHDEQI